MNIRVSAYKFGARIAGPVEASSIERAEQLKEICFSNGVSVAAGNGRQTVYPDEVEIKITFNR